MKYIKLFIECFASYFYLVLLLRFLGKKEMSKLSIYDLIVFLLISELMTLSIGNEEISFMQSAFASLVIVLFDKICSYLSLRFKWIKKILEGHPTYIIYQGRLLKYKMKSLNYSIDDLCHHLRQEGIASLSEVEFAVLETDGNLSVIKKTDYQVMIPSTLISDGEINEDILETIHKDKKWLFHELKKAGIKDYHDIFYCVYEKDGLFYIRK